MKVENLANKASDIKLNHVGKRLLSKTTRRSVMSMQEGDGGDMEQMDYNWEKGLQQQTKTSMYRYTLMEDTRVSRFTHHQLLLVEKNILVLAILVIFLNMMKVEADRLFPVKDISANLMIVISSTICMLVLLAVLRRILSLQLNLDQRRVYVPYSERDDCRSSLWMILRNPSELRGLLIEVVLILPHPMTFLEGQLYTLVNENKEMTLTYSYNDLLSMLMMAKIYLVMRSLVTMSVYCSPRAVRLCTYNSIDHSHFFSLKCMQQQYPLTFTIVITLVIMFIFGFGFRVTQGNLYYLNPTLIAKKTGFQDYFTCLWFTFTTMTSIGYGDYIPVTDVGRLLAGCISIFGVILNSFLVVALTEYLKMKTGEIRSHTTLYRLRQQGQLFDQSAQILAETIEVTRMITQYHLDPNMLRQLRPVFEGLKRKIDRARAMSRWKKSILPQQNKTELMIHEFELVKDNFRALYNNQRKIRQKIDRVEQVRGIRVNEQVQRRFIHEITNIVQP